MYHIRDISTLPSSSVTSTYRATDDCMVGGYNIQRGTTVFANVWAIHRDPNIWEEPEKFKPERFEKKGEDKKLITFGMGRRGLSGVWASSAGSAFGSRVDDSVF